MGYITEAQLNDPNYIDPYSGAPIGISSTAWKNGSYTQVPSGGYVYVGPQYQQPEYNPGWVGAGHNSLENQSYIAQEKLYNDYRQSQADLLRNSNISQANFIDEQARLRAANPSYVNKSYVDTDAYAKNRNAAYDSTAKYNATKESTQNDYQKQIDARNDAQQALLAAQMEAQKRILHNDDALTRQDIITNRAIKGNTNTDLAALTYDYLKSIGMTTDFKDANGKPVLMGVGNSNFNPATGQFAITQAQRDQLKKDRADLLAGKYDDRIAQGDFSPSGTGLEGYDGKPINSPAFAFMNPNDSSGGVSSDLKQQANYLASMIANGGKLPTSYQQSASPQGQSSDASLDAFRQMLGGFMSSMQQSTPQANASTGPTTEQQGTAKSTPAINASTGPSTASALSGGSQQQSGPTLASSSTKSRGNYKSGGSVPMTTPVNRNPIRLV